MGENESGTRKNGKQYKVINSYVGLYFATDFKADLLTITPDWPHKSSSDNMFRETIIL